MVKRGVKDTRVAFKLIDRKQFDNSKVKKKKDRQTDRKTKVHKKQHAKLKAKRNLPSTMQSCIICISASVIQEKSHLLVPMMHYYIVMVH